MKTTFSALALLRLATSVNADGQSHLPVDHVRSLGMKAIHKARSEIQSGRKLEWNATDFGMDMGDFDFDLLDWNDTDIGMDMGDFDLGDMMGDLMTSMAPVICWMFGTSPGEFIDDMADGGGFACSEFGCDDPNADIPNLVMKCSMDDEVCEKDINNEEFCVKNTTIEMSIGLNFGGKTPVLSTQCSTYTSPDYMAEMGPGCLSIDTEINMDAMMNGAIGDIMNGDMDEVTDEAIMASTEYFEFTDCSGEWDNGSIITTCTCGFCNDGMGFELTCSNDLISEECTNYDMSTIDGITTGGQGGEAAESPDGLSASNVAVLRLIPTPDAGDIVTLSDAPDAGDIVAESDAADDVEEPDASNEGNAVEDDAGDAVKESGADDAGEAIKEADTVEEPVVNDAGEATNEAGAADAGNVDASINDDGTSPAFAYSGASIAGVALAFSSILIMV